MPRVLRIINRFNLGGITYNVSYLSKYLPMEYETMLIGGPEEDSEESSLHIPQELNLQPFIVKELRRSINPFSDFLAYRKIKKIIKEFNPQIVHTHASKAGAIGRLAAFHSRVPVIVHTFHGHVFHGYFGKLKTAIILKIERYLAKKSSAIIAISETQKRELVTTHEIAPASKIAVIPLGFDLQKFENNANDKRVAFRKKYFVQNDELLIVIIGRLAPIKNHFLFIDAIQNASEKSSKKIRAFIIGDGETKARLISYLRSKNLSYVEEAGQAALFTFTGWIKNVDLPLAACDLVALSSINEGTPVSLIEAQAASKFIVSTRVGGIEDILHPDCGLLSDADNAQEFWDNILYAVNHLEELNKKAGQAAEQVKVKFGYKRLCKEMSTLYQELLTKVQ